MPFEIEPTIDDIKAHVYAATIVDTINESEDQLLEAERLSEVWSKIRYTLPFTNEDIKSIKDTIDCPEATADSSDSSQDYESDKKELPIRRDPLTQKELMKRARDFRAGGLVRSGHTTAKRQTREEKTIARKKLKIERYNNKFAALSKQIENEVALEAILKINHDNKEDIFNTCLDLLINSEIANDSKFKNHSAIIQKMVQSIRLLHQDEITDTAQISALKSDLDNLELNLSETIDFFHAEKIQTQDSRNQQLQTYRLKMYTKALDTVKNSEPFNILENLIENQTSTSLTP